MTSNRRSLLLAPLVVGCALLVFAFLPTAAQAETIKFDDVDASAGDVSIDGINPYHGYTWTNFSITTQTPGFPGFNNGIVSGPNAAYSGGETSSGGTVSPVVGSLKSISGLFDFSSAELGAGYYDNLSLRVEGSRNGTTLFDQTITVGTTGARLFSFNYTQIDTLTLFAFASGSTTDPYQCGSFNCTQFTVDDLTVIPAPVPIPAAGFLLLCGLGSLAPFARHLRPTAV